ncbi:hypothetical protein EJB05_00757 [Eragrostis curvula]|uniref:Uncharacterized protein n=1 Tax=Eragrostis curvula TaxID=38414 RepID=A0A5J9WQ76_9POAL|nr:hypothetical protein EJB05_00757 [Eragrostis curvula]
MEVPDDILSLILQVQRIDSHISLIRATAVCKKWCRTIASSDFFCRYRSLHSSAISGNYHYDTPVQSYLIGSPTGARSSVGPVFIPSSSSIHTRNFTLDFLGVGTSRTVVAASFLCITDDQNTIPHLRPDMSVCEPLTRCYLRIPPPSYLNDDFYFWGSYLVDGAYSHINFSNFRVMCLFIRRYDQFSFATVFSEAGGAG